MKNRFCLMILAAVLGIGLVPAARATAIYTTLGPGGAFDTNDFVQFGSSLTLAGVGAYADEFTSPVTTTVGSVSLALATPVVFLGGASTDASTINVGIRSNTPTGPGGPTDIVGSFGSATVTKAGIYTFTATTAIHLVAGTEYWLFVGAGESGEPLDWFLNNQGIDNSTASRSEGVWTVNGSTTAVAFELDTVPEPGSAALCATGLMAAYVWRKRIGVSRKP